MAPNPLNARWLRPALATLALAALAALGGCGGGSGAPNNPYAPKPVAPGPVVILPTTVTVYSNTPATLTITGGTPPFFVVSSDASILPLAASVTNSTIVLLPAPVTAPTGVLVTATDSLGVQGQANVTVSPAPIFNTLTVTPGSSACGTNAICSGQSATAAVTVTGPGGAPIPGRAVRFDVVSGAFAIQSSDPAHPLVSTLTVVSDANGVAQVIIVATVNAPTQPALLRATELTTGDEQTTAFTIVQTINGSSVLSVVPATATITGAFTGECSAGFRTDYYIYGGTPPYTVASTFPDAVIVLNTPVPAAGDAFTAVTNGTCVNPLTFTIRDSGGLQTTATLINQQGTVTPPGPPPPTALQILPATISFAGCGPATFFNFIIIGGTSPYSVSTTTPGVTATPSVVDGSGSTVKVGPFTTTGTTSVIVLDSSSPQASVTGTVTCT
jgi:hypothetical protein